MKILPLASIICLIVIQSASQDANGQFFTKSSKSIPRMGRRSMLEEQQLAASRMSPARRVLLDELIDEYGPGLLSALGRARVQAQMMQIDSATPLSAANAQQSNGNEFVIDNDQQPFDMMAHHYSIIPQSHDHHYHHEQISRDERSEANRQKVSQDSLAMRALNANRLLQRLAAGGQPSASYTSLGLNSYPSSNKLINTNSLAQKYGVED